MSEGTSEATQSRASLPCRRGAATPSLKFGLAPGAPLPAPEPSSPELALHPGWRSPGLGSIAL